MEISKDDNAARYQIRRYASGLVQINQESHEQSLIIANQQMITDWPVLTLADLSPEHWQAVLSLQPEIILLGTGQCFQQPTAEQLKPLDDAGIPYEYMDTAAACRTFVALQAEQRHVVAALIIEENHE